MGLPFRYAANPRNRANLDVLALVASATDGCAFAVGQFGAPGTLATMYQDVLGQMPVTAAGQSVARIIDQTHAGAVGSELVVNGNPFSSTGWTINTGWTISGGLASHSGTGTGALTRAITLTTGKTHQVTVTMSSYTSGSFVVRFTGGTTSTGATISAGGTTTFLLDGLSGNTTLSILPNSGGGTWAIASISVKELLGWHPKQATGSQQPILQQDARGFWCLDFDATDDNLTTPQSSYLVQLPHFVGLVGINQGPAGASLFGAFVSNTVQSHNINNNAVAGRVNARLYDTTIGALQTAPAHDNVSTTVPTYFGSLAVVGTLDQRVNSDDVATAANSWVAGTNGLSAVRISGGNGGHRFYGGVMMRGLTLSAAQRLSLRRTLMAKLAGYDI